ncbi:MAG: hypothetical protein KatS3mg019_1061 [Fimbriimonadales bacterium]|nr:MAG: hypothetical protein KatS3mg019_1061 [Fimbriimonadales bacterium]
MRTIHRMMAIAACWASVVLMQAQSADSVQTSSAAVPTAWIAQLDIDQIDPRKQENLPKITLLLRSWDIPRSKRLEYARRYLRGEYKFHTLNPEPPLHDNYWYVLNEAVEALGRLNDVESIPWLEEKLALWEAEAKKPDPERAMVVPSLPRARAVLARLKAVRDVPQVKNATDLIRRFERMLYHVGFVGNLSDWHRELRKEFEEADKCDHCGPGVQYEILLQYGQMLMEAGWRGVDITAASKIIQLDSKVGYEGGVKKTFEVYVQLAKIPLDQLAQHIVDEAVHWQVYSDGEAPKAQVLADMGVTVLPIVWEKLKWAGQNRDQLKGSGVGMGVLLEILVTVGGEQALPLIEPFLNDENKWVRYYACQAKEYIQQGKVFLFAPYF